MDPFRSVLAKKAAVKVPSMPCIGHSMIWTPSELFWLMQQMPSIRSTDRQLFTILKSFVHPFPKFCLIPTKPLFGMWYKVKGRSSHQKAQFKEGDPLAMAMYTITVRPLIDHLQSHCFEDSKGFWYHPNANKTHLICEGTVSWKSKTIVCRYKCKHYCTR